MKTFGWILVTVGVVWLIYAYNLDTSVSTGGGLYMPSRVVNLDLVQERQTHIYLASFATLIGVLLILFGKNKDEVAAEIPTSELPKTSSTPAEPPCERDLSKDAYRLWLADQYGITRNDLFDKFVLRSQTYPNLDTALSAAHELELISLEERTLREEAEQQADEERQAQIALMNEELERSQRTSLIFCGALILIVIVLMIVFTDKTDAKISPALEEDARKRFSQYEIALPEDWSINSFEEVFDSAADRAIWCNDGPGRLATMTVPASANQIISHFDEALGKGNNPYASIQPASHEDDDGVIAREYRQDVTINIFSSGNRSQLYVCFK